jgi:hypothetical protein
MTKTNNNKEISALKKMLKYGDYQKIAEETGYTEVYIGNVLCSRQEITDKNFAIIESAQKIVKARKAVSDKRANKLNAFLSQNKA